MAVIRKSKGIIERLAESFRKYKKEKIAGILAVAAGVSFLFNGSNATSFEQNKTNLIDLTKIPRCEQIVRNVERLEKIVGNTHTELSRESFSREAKEEISIAKKLLNGAKSIDLQIAKTESGKTFCIVTRVNPDGTAQEEILGNQVREELLKKGQVNYKTVHEIKINDLNGAYLIKGHSEEPVQVKTKDGIQSLPLEYQVGFGAGYKVQKAMKKKEIWSLGGTETSYTLQESYEKAKKQKTKQDSYIIKGKDMVNPKMF